ncbi:MAG: patatin-like phospholipase family protein [Bdellovibrio bacteriovorus]
MAKRDKGKPAGKRVSLVLGSGGARGLAHIGVIQWLEQQGYHIESIAGASMGALVGGIHAAGELDTYRDWVCALSRTDVLRFLDFAFSAGGLFKGDRIMDTLREMVGEHAIEDLPIAYTAVATDIDRQREVWISKGPLFDAIRASIAVPTVFTPHRYLGLTLVDGGLLNPVPIAPTFRDRTDLTIAVNLNGPDKHLGRSVHGQDREPEAAPKADLASRIRQFLDGIGDNLIQGVAPDLGLFELVSRSIETMQNAITAVKLAAYAPDVVIEVPRDACGAHEFYRAREVIELGHRLAEDVMRKGVAGIEERT